jgi:multicomponent Na+:H+ antiporter subunit D
MTGSLSYDGIAAGLAALPDGGGHAAALATACIVAAIAIRVAVMPVYGWLPDAHALAPHAISAVLSGVLIKTPLFALGRLLAFLPLGSKAASLVGTAGVATALVAVIVALSQKDVKRLLAYHSISQIGYIVAAWGLGTPDGLSAAWLHAFYHALFKGLLFLSVGTIVDAAGTRDVYELRGAGAALARAGDRGRITAIAYAVGAFSIAALPPFNGFASKNAIGSLFKGDWPYWILFAAGVCTVASFIKLSMIFLPSGHGSAARSIGEETDTQAGHGFRVTVSMKAAMMFLALACITTGLFSVRMGDFASALLGPAAGLAIPAAWGGGELGKTGLTVLGGIALYALAASPPGRRTAKAIRERPRSFAGLVTAFIAGLAALGAFLVLPS